MKEKIRVMYVWEKECDVTIDVITGNEEQDDGNDISITRFTETTERTTRGSMASAEQTVPGNHVGLIRRATGIPAHVMLMADMQNVLASQQNLLFQLKTTITAELDKRQVGHSTFQVQHQVESMLRNFESKVIKKLDAFSESDGKDETKLSSGPGGLWYHWGGQYRRVPRDYEFPNKMTLKSAWVRYFLPDNVKKIGPMRYFTGTDLVNVKTGRRNLSALKFVMDYMITIAKNKKIYINNPTEKQVLDMYHKISGSVLSLTNNSRAKSFSWHTHVRKVRKKIKLNSITN